MLNIIRRNEDNVESDFQPAYSKDKVIKYRKFALIVAAIVVGCIVSSAVLTKNAVMKKNYSSALALEEAREYKEAAGAFQILDRYADSPERIVSCEDSLMDASYDAAVVLKEAGKYDAAIAAFEAMDGYKDSDDYISECYFLKINVGDTYLLGHYEQDNDNSNGKEDIEWTVLAKEDGKILLISKYALDCQPYNVVDTDVVWETCSLRKWLNSTFFNDAFSAEEQTMIEITKVTADKNFVYGTDSGNATTDKVYLLSVNEAEMYFNSFMTTMSAPTEFAISKGASISEYYMTNGKASCCWWLRSPGNFQDRVASVRSDGTIIDSTGSLLCYVYNCVRPALWIRV